MRSLVDYFPASAVCACANLFNPGPARQAKRPNSLRLVHILHFSNVVGTGDWSADILVRFDNVGKPQADKNVCTPEQYGMRPNAGLAAQPGLSMPHRSSYKIAVLKFPTSCP